MECSSDVHPRGTGARSGAGQRWRVSRVNRRSLHRLCRRLHCPRVSCSCLFYPSTFKETFGLVLAEANAVGTPVIKLAGPALLGAPNPSQQCFALCAVATTASAQAACAIVPLSGTLTRACDHCASEARRWCVCRGSGPARVAGTTRQLHFRTCAAVCCVCVCREVGTKSAVNEDWRTSPFTFGSTVSCAHT